VYKITKILIESNKNAQNEKLKKIAGKNKTQFNSNEDAKKSLNDSRDVIDSIDNQIWDLISQRLSLAKNIIVAKVYLCLPITDYRRELMEYNNVNNINHKKNLDQGLVYKITKILIESNKNTQYKEFMKINSTRRYYSKSVLATFDIRQHI
jgi:chorismate mutase